VDIIRTAFYIHAPEFMELISPFYMRHERLALHVVIKWKVLHL